MIRTSTVVRSLAISAVLGTRGHAHHRRIRWRSGQPARPTRSGVPGRDGRAVRHRQAWYWEAAPGCDRVIAQDAGATPVPWDVDPATGPSTHTTLGNNAQSYEN